MGEPHSGPPRVEREQLVRPILLAALVLRVSGVSCLRLRLEWRGGVGQLPLPDDREGLAEAAIGARGGESDCPPLGVFYLVGTRGA